MTDVTNMRVLAISGSLRKGALNTALLRAAQELAPEGMAIDIYDDLSSIPPYDGDALLAGFPPSVEALRHRLRDADAMIFATPEYNRSYPGVLKNAIDWASRAPAQPFDGKPALVTGASPGLLGTALANYHLRQVLSVLGVHTVPGREVLVGSATGKFDADGRLVDEPTRDALGKALLALKRLSASIRV